jgi:hypothetical protein
VLNNFRGHLPGNYTYVVSAVWIIAEAKMKKIIKINNGNINS